MTVSHRATDAPAYAAAFQAPKPVKVARMACCCKLSELLPLVQQMHAATRQQAEAGTSKAA